VLVGTLAMLLSYVGYEDAVGGKGTVDGVAGMIQVHIIRFGHSRTCTPYMTVCTVISLLEIPYIHHMYTYTEYNRM